MHFHKVKKSAIIAVTTSLMLSSVAMFGQAQVNPPLVQASGYVRYAPMPHGKWHLVKTVSKTMEPRYSSDFTFGAALSWIAKELGIDSNLVAGGLGVVSDIVVSDYLRHHKAYLVAKVYRRSNSYVTQYKVKYYYYKDSSHHHLIKKLERTQTFVKKYALKKVK